MNCPEFLKNKCPAHRILSTNGSKKHCWDIEDAKKFCKHHGQGDCMECPWLKYSMDKS
jgi:hypothetical protein